MEMEMDLVGKVLRREGEERRERDVGLEAERGMEFGVRERKWREQVEEEAIVVDAAPLGV